MVVDASDRCGSEAPRDLTDRPDYADPRHAVALLPEPTAPLTMRAPPDGATVVWQPLRVEPTEPGFQDRALAAGADEVFLGGAKGPGKTDVLIASCLRQAHFPLYAAAFVRGTFANLARPMDRARAIFTRLPAAQRPAYSGSPHPRWTFPSGAIVQFGYTEKGVEWSQGGNWAEIKYDEMGNEADEKKVDILQSEIRCPDPRIRRSLMGSGNPGFAGHPWIKRRYIVPCGRDGSRIAWAKTVLKDGRVIWTSRQFVPGRIEDNPILLADEKYMALLSQLPERMRRCLLEGDWDAAAGVALDELDEAVHFRPGLTNEDLPAHWPYISGFDWGFTHNAVFIWGRVSDDGRIFICDTLKRRLLRDWDLAGAFVELVPAGARVQVHAGTDVKAEIEARDRQKSTQATFAERDIHVVLGDTRRVFGYQNMLEYFAWRPSDYVPKRDPKVLLLDTPGNRWLFEQLEDMVLDPDDPRDVLKVDADGETGEGGDDGYDALRVLLAQRPQVARSGFAAIETSAFDPAILRAEAQRALKGAARPAKRRKRYF